MATFDPRIVGPEVLSFLRAYPQVVPFHLAQARTPRRSVTIRAVATTGSMSAKPVYTPEARDAEDRRPANGEAQPCHVR